MIRIALPAMLMLAAGCSAEPQSEQPVANAVAATTPPTRVSAAPPAAAAGNGLRATVSDLTGTVSGLNTRMTEMGLVIDLPADALFEYDKADLTPAAEAELRKAAELIRRSPPGAISIVGHTDGKGDDAYNRGCRRRVPMLSPTGSASKSACVPALSPFPARGKARPSRPTLKQTGATIRPGGQGTAAWKSSSRQRWNKSSIRFSPRIATLLSSRR